MTAVHATALVLQSCAKSYIRLAWPLGGFGDHAEDSSYGDIGDDARAAQLLQLRQFVYDGFTERLRAEAATGGAVDVVYYLSGGEDRVGGYLQWFGQKKLLSDLALAGTVRRFDHQVVHQTTGTC